MDLVDYYMVEVQGHMNNLHSTPPIGHSGNQILVEICELELEAQKKAPTRES